ncbi:UNVERIFIED_CONTAM: hypothetical protein GTU68_002043 [Idotea baltica]|nr:hypothetical protein [Idotea baltica]
MTPEREEKFKKVIAKKQKGLTIILENVHDPHNISAVLRSCDAVGVNEVYVVYSEPALQKSLGKRSSGSANKWLDVHYFFELEPCIDTVKKKYGKILATHLADDNPTSLYDVDFTENTALLFGNEKDGVSKKALDLSDGNFIIPQHGLIQSLNISVACAVSLYEVQRQRGLKGMYTSPTFSDLEQEQILNNWKER